MRETVRRRRPHDRTFTTANPQWVYVGWRQGVFAADAKEKLRT